MGCVDNASGTELEQLSLLALPATAGPPACLAGSERAGLALTTRVPADTVYNTIQCHSQGHDRYTVVCVCLLCYWHSRFCLYFYYVDPVDCFGGLLVRLQKPNETKKGCWGIVDMKKKKVYIDVRM